MECNCTKMSLIYSDHTTGYIDILWCSKCGSLQFNYEDDQQFREPENKSTPRAEGEELSPDDAVELAVELEREMLRVSIKEVKELLDNMEAPFKHAGEIVIEEIETRLTKKRQEVWSDET